MEDNWNLISHKTFNSLCPQPFLENAVYHIQSVVKNREAWCAAVHGVTELDKPEWLNNNKPQAKVGLKQRTVNQQRSEL